MSAVVEFYPGQFADWNPTGALKPTADDGRLIILMAANRGHDVTKRQVSTTAGSMWVNIWLMERAP